MKLEGSNLRKTYEGRVVVDLPAISVRSGESLALLGPNGAGKSTLLRLLALLEEPDGGRILMDGREVTWKDLSARRRLAVVFQRPVLFQGDVAGNVAYGLRLRKESRKRTPDKVAEVLELVGLSAFKDADVRKLSGGELQRVALARALVLDPDILFLDEPTSNLDPGLRRSFRRELRDLFARLETTVVLVTHDQAEALLLADRVAVMRDGRIVQTGLSEEVFAQPTDSFVAEFMGVETLWPGEVVRSEGGEARVITEQDVGVEVLSNARPGDSVTLAVRAEDVVLSLAPVSAGPPTSPRNRWKGVVEHLESSGPVVRISLAIENGAPSNGDRRRARLVSMVTRSSAREMGLAPGVAVEAAVKATAVHVIPASEEAEEAQPGDSGQAAGGGAAGGGAAGGGAAGGGAAGGGAAGGQAQARQRSGEGHHPLL